MIKLSIVIVSFNTQELITNLLKGLEKAIKVCEDQGYRVELIVIDNHSLDESIRLIKNKFKDVKLIQNKTNIGFAAASNQGIQEAKGELILLLNSDTKVFEKTLVKAVKFMDQNPSAGAMTCRVELANGKIDPASHRGFPTPWNAFCYFTGLEKIFGKWRMFGGYHQSWKDLDKTHEIDACSGAFFLVRKTVIDKIGLLDERFFMYAEDLDWAYRMRQAGYKIYYFPKTKIIHYKHQSGIKKLNDKLIKSTTKENFYRTMKLFYDKHYQYKYPQIVRKIVFWGIRMIGRIRG